jgi:hypothetical protein
MVVGWQPGEYQQNTLDDHDRLNFQVPVNATYFAGSAQKNYPADCLENLQALSSSNVCSRMPLAFT